MAAPLECGTNLADLLSSALPPDKKVDNGCRATTPPATTAAPPTVNGVGDRFAELEERANVWGGRGFDASVLHDVVGNALDDLHLDEPLSLVAALDRDLADSEGGGGSAPVPVPVPPRPLRAYSPPAAGSPLPPFLRYAHEGSFGSRVSAAAAAALGSGGGGELQGEVTRLREEVAGLRAAAARWDERVAGARAACGAWQRESEEAARAAALAERQRDEARALAASLRRDLEAAALHSAPRRDLRTLPLAALKALQAAARADLEEIEKVLYLETATKCMSCEEQPRAVTLAPCNHYVVCEGCAASARECPYCLQPLPNNHHH